MYNTILKVHGEYLAKEQALPQNTSADGNGVSRDLSGTLGGVEIVAEVAADITLADTKTLTVSLMDQPDGGSFEELGKLAGVTASGVTTLTAGTILGRFVIPTDAGTMVKAVITTDDSAASGSLSVYPHYLAR